MIHMWDETFVRLDPSIEKDLAGGHGRAAFERMHLALDAVWRECCRVLRPGGLCCINVGDATRTIGGSFELYANGARIVSSCASMGFAVLPRVIWRKSTNAPNKFMGSGMLPGGAYVTLEHEHILIFRKGTKREFDTEGQKVGRRRSAYFWEERNMWFSDVWTDLIGARQKSAANSARERTGAYPTELAYRLVHMYSVQGDTVLDPFLGTGTTCLAALAGARSSIGAEIDEGFIDQARSRIFDEWRSMNERTERRLLDHIRFVGEYRARGREPAHVNEHHGFPVITSQERGIVLPRIESVAEKDGAIHATYLPYPDPSGPLFAQAP